MEENLKERRNADYQSCFTFYEGASGCLVPGLGQGADMWTDGWRKRVQVMLQTPKTERTNKSRRDG